MNLRENDPRTPVREYTERNRVLALLPIGLVSATALAGAIMLALGLNKPAMYTLVFTALYGCSLLRMRFSRVYAGRGWLRRGKKIVQIDALTGITFKNSILHAEKYEAVFDVGLTDRDGRTLHISSNDLTESAILDFFREGLYKSVASGLVLDEKTHAFVIRHLHANAIELKAAAAVAARFEAKARRQQAADA